MRVGDVSQGDEGLWRVSVWPGHADVLLSALDPAAPLVLIETWDGVPDWHEVLVGIGADGEPRLRLVRRHTFDLLVNPVEAVEVGREIRAHGLSAGGMCCYQFRQRPSADFRLPSQSRSLTDAMRDQGVLIAVELPHDGEVAVASSADFEAVDSFARRLVAEPPV